MKLIIKSNLVGGSTMREQHAIGIAQQNYILFVTKGIFMLF